MRISRHFYWIAVSIALAAGGAGSVWAEATRCFGPEKTLGMTETLKQLVKDRQFISNGFYDWWDVYQRGGRLKADLRKVKVTEEELGCLGFHIGFRGVAPSLEEEILGRMAPAFLLLDESMFPADLRPRDTRPDYFNRRIGRSLRVVDHFRTIKNAAGVYNSFTKRITYPLFIFNQSWEMWLSSQDLPGGEQIHSFHGGWDNWDCGYPNNEGEFQVVVHEYGHDVDFALRGKLWFSGKYSSKTSGWKRLHETEFTSPYGNTSKTEDFAESFAAYLLDPLMKCYAPGKYAWFANFTRINEEIYGSPLPYAGVDCGQPEIRGLMELRQKKTEEMKACKATKK